MADFSDLTPPDEQLNEWRERPATVNDSLIVAYRAGAQHGYIVGKAEWPDPITDRPPTEADFDGYGWIQVVDDSGGWWRSCHRETPVKGRPWLHTPRWRPPAPSKREQALALIAKRFTDAHDCPGLLHPDELRLICEALEESNG